ncbi:uncharacterized protein LOC117640686 [Thrips palmi]|uniref:Uncharacterized protein LOC117640686 n=1 Tax=Thrips palmi TaxID=161013 RepID=A0A6P8ZIC8_THRPL|nr:uncharacterized protein LOC117640686 [Thrips palmi]
MNLVLLGCILAALGVPGTPAPLATVTAVLDASNDALDFRSSEPVGAEGDIDPATLSSGRTVLETGLTQRVRQEAVVREQAAESLGTSSARPQTPRAPTKLKRSTSGPWAPASSRPVTWAPRTSRPFTWAPRRSTPGSWVPGGSGGSGGWDSWDGDWGWDSDWDWDWVTGSYRPFDATTVLIIMGLLIFVVAFFMVCRLAIGS